MFYGDKNSRKQERDTWGPTSPCLRGMFSRFSLGGKDKKEEKESPSKGRASMQSVSSDTVDFNAMLDNSFLASTL